MSSRNLQVAATELEWERVCSTIEGKYAGGGSIDSLSVKNEEVLGKLLWMLL